MEGEGVVGEGKDLPSPVDTPGSVGVAGECASPSHLENARPQYKPSFRGPFDTHPDGHGLSA